MLCLGFHIDAVFRVFSYLLCLGFHIGFTCVQGFTYVLRLAFYIDAVFRVSHMCCV